MTNQTIRDFVQEIAQEDPITSRTDYVNECRYCDSSWAESSYSEYVANEAILATNPDARQPNGVYRIAWEHHNDDCIWVRANQIIS